MASKTRKLEVLITGNAKQAQKAMGDLDRAAGRTSKSTTKSLSGITKGLVGVGAAAAAWRAFDGWNESQKILQQTDAVIASTGASANVTAGEINDLATEISLATGIHDEAVQSGQNLLLTFTKLQNQAGEGNDIFDQATKIMVDMSVAMGTDTKQSAIQLGKALNDPVKGVAALTRVGVQFTDQQKAQIKALQESGDLMGAQKVILAELSTQFEGSAEAQATSMDKAKVSISNMSDEMIGVLAPAIETVTGGVGTLAQGFSNLPQPVQNVTIGVAAFAALAPKVKELGESALDSARGMKESAAASKNLGRNVGVAAAGVGAFTATLALLNEASDFDGSIEDLTTDLENFGRGATGLDTAVGETGRSVEELASAFTLNASKADDFWEGLDKFRKSGGVGGALDMRQASSDLDALDQSLAGMVKDGNIDAARDAYGRMASVMIEAGVPAEHIADAMNDYHDQLDRSEQSGAAAAISGVSDATSDAAGSTKDAADASETYADKLSDIKKEADDATTAIEEFFGAQTDSTGSKIEAERALDDLTESIREHGLALSIDGEAGRTNREAIIGARDAALDYAMSIREQTGSSEAAATAMHNYAGSLRQTLIDGGFTEEQVNSLIAEMGLTPADITTTFHENATESEIKTKAFNDELDRITPNRSVRIDIDIEAAMAKLRELSSELGPLGSSVLSGTGGRAAQESLRGRADGGPISAGTPYLVGEEGPELVIPKAAGTVIPANKTASMLSDAGRPGRQMPFGGRGTHTPPPIIQHFHIAGSVLAERELVDISERGIAQNARLTGGTATYQPWTQQ